MAMLPLAPTPFAAVVVVAVAVPIAVMAAVVGTTIAAVIVVAHRHRRHHHRPRRDHDRARCVGHGSGRIHWRRRIDRSRMVDRRRLRHHHARHADADIDIHTGVSTSAGHQHCTACYRHCDDSFHGCLPRGVGHGLTVGARAVIWGARSVASVTWCNPAPAGRAGLACIIPTRCPGIFLPSCSCAVPPPPCWH
ncbi:hypothetical protein [Cupriavidus taiwanensis]|uniref:hypothetical protein n=1 Tax=Cupriavidus taiwanensis TaxID=164546 RepID=UPI0034CD1174